MVQIAASVSGTDVKLRNCNKAELSQHNRFAPQAFVVAQQFANRGATTGAKTEAETGRQEVFGQPQSSTDKHRTVTCDTWKIAIIRLHIQNGLIANGYLWHMTTINPGIPCIPIPVSKRRGHP
jgi:hypothetical protein